MFVRNKEVDEKISCVVNIDRLIALELSSSVDVGSCRGDAVIDKFPALDSNVLLQNVSFRAISPFRQIQYVEKISGDTARLLEGGQHAWYCSTRTYPFVQGLHCSK